MKLADLLPTENWMTRGICANTPTERDLWFSDSKTEQAHAIQACHRCPVFDECREYMQAARPSHGIWAGERADMHTRNFTPEQHALHRALREAPSLVAAAESLGLSRSTLLKIVQDSPAPIRHAYDECKSRRSETKRVRAMSEEEKRERIAVMTAAVSRMEAARALGVGFEYLTSWIRKNGTEQQKLDWQELPIKETQIV